MIAPVAPVPPVALALLAAVAAAGAVALLLPRRGPALGRRADVDVLGPTPPRGRPGMRAAVASGAAAALVVAVVPGRTTVLAVVLGCAGLAASGLARRRAARVARRTVAGRVQEACELLAADLAAGLPPVTALGRAAQDWEALAPVARAADLGGDVPTALRQLAGTPGAADLARLAAAWQVSQRTGQRLAEPVARTSAALRRARATRRVVDSELASARATARLLAGLPVLALLMGSGAGGAPWRFLLATPSGLGCLAGGLALGLLGLTWIERIAEGVEAAG